MFKKAQLKVFAIITCILLAIFIAVLGSVNIIMQAVMQRQSKDVLKKIAAGVEYNDTTHQFMISRPENFGKKPVQDEVPPPKPTETEASQEHSSQTAPPSTASVTTSTTAATTTTATAVTAAVIPTPEPTAAPTPAEKTTETPTFAPTAENIPEPTVTASVTSPTTQPPQPIVTAPVTAKPTHPTTQPTAPTPQQPPSKTVPEPTKPHPEATEPTTENQQPQGPWWFDPNNPPDWFDPNTPPPWWGNWGYWNGWNNWNNNWQGWNGWQGYQAPNSKFNEHTPTEDTSAEDTSNCEKEKCRSTEPASLQETPSPLGLNTISYEDELTMISDIKNDENKHREPMDDGQQTLDQIPRSLGSIDFFIVMADKDGNFLASINNDDLNETQAQNYISAILKENLNSGMIENKYQFYKTEKNNGTIMVFTDKGAEMNMLNKLIRTTILIGTISLILLAAAAFFLSRKVIQPLKLAFDKQKQFISDASHELKTPLTVISANADVLSGEIGENRWLTYIKSQTDRMNVLVNDLLNLTRLENNSTDFVRTDFDLSKAIINTALPFECQAFESNKQFDVDIESGLTINGSERHIKQMAAIFIDNALKYSGEGGTVKVTLRKISDRKVLSIYNTGQGIKDEEKDKIFERFYRSDQSRNRATGGYGLGLAIAKSIIDKHKFRIHIENHEGKSIRFVIIM